MVTGFGFRYGLYPFVAENEDEISFQPGEKIEILEQDDQYGDGWWQGRNEAGQEGLFPALDYTSADPPSTTDDLETSRLSQTSLPNGTDLPVTSPPSPRASTPTKDLSSPKAGDAAPLPESHPSPQMNATLTDVQAAIDQLGVRGGDGNRSVVSIPTYPEDSSVRSFATDSMHDGETASLADEDHQQVGWSARTRRRLAEKALAENQRKTEKDAEEARLGRVREESEQRNWQASRDAPEGLEFSDESEDEDSIANQTPRLNGKARYSPEPAAVAPSPVLAPPIELNTLPAAAPKSVVDAPPAPSSETPAFATTLAEGVSEPLLTETPVGIPSAEDLPSAAQRAENAFHTASTARSAVSLEPSPFQSVVPDQFESPAVADEKADIEAAAPDAEVNSTRSRPQSFIVNRKPSGDLNKVASPPARSVTLPSPSQQQDSLPELPRERNNSLPVAAVSNGVDRSSVGSANGYMSPGGMRRTSSNAGISGTAGMAGEPIEWGVDEVVEWAKRRGFDQAVWGKFEEHEITGDVLLEMDINLLKEIEITAFGKRMKLAAAISELRPHNDQRTGSIRSGYSPTQTTFTPNGGFSGMGPSPGFVFGQQQSRAPSEVYPNGLPSSASQYASNWSQEQTARAPPSGNSIVGLGFAGAEDKTKSRQSSLSAPPSPLNQTVPVPQAPPMPVPTHARTPSGVESLQGTRIVEEPADFNPAGSINLASPTLGSSVSPASKNPATFSRTDVGSYDSKVSNSVPPSPASGSTFPKKGSISHKKSKASVDEGRSGSGSISNSFMGGFMGGSKNGRKPAPRVSGGSASGGTPDLSSKSPKLGGSSGFRRASKAPESDKGTLKKRMSVVEPEGSPKFPQGESNPSALRALDRIPKPEFAGYLRKKGDRYNSWKLRYCVLAGPHFYYLKSENDAKFKGYINMQGYKVIADENANPGSYGFRIIHEKEPSHFFSLQEQHLVRDWMKALMKATINRDYSAPVVSSCNIPTMSLKEAQAMSPAPRPPSPSQRLATQMASRRDNPNQLTARDASILMGLQNGSADGRKPSVPDSLGTPAAIPPRPSRDVSRSTARPSQETTRRASGARPLSTVSNGRPVSEARPLSNGGRPVSGVAPTSVPAASLQIAFINANLPPDFPRVTSNPESFRSGLALVRAVEHITSTTSNIPIKDYAVKTKQEHEDLLYRAFDFFIDSGVNMDGLHVDDVVIGNPAGIDKIIDRIQDLKRA